MPRFNLIAHSLAGRFILVLASVALAVPAFAQRHPESAGPLPYYSTEPGTPRDPEWQQRPPFLRGPQDRYQRGWGRAFLNAGDSIPYLNYADQQYILYFRETIPWAVTSGRQIGTRNVRWDRMGNYMGSSYRRVFTVEESRSGSDFSGYSYIDHKFLSFNIGHYTYKDLHWTATVGNGVSGSQVRTILTPLTLTNSQQNVLRMDLDYKQRDRATVFYSRGGSGGAAQLFSEWAFGAGDDTWDSSPVLLFGGHWQHDFGQYASMGGTLVNQIMASPALSRSSALRGDLPYDMLGPKTIRVFIGDDSPEEDQANARVFGVDIVLEGERGGQQVRLTSIEGDPDFDPSLVAPPPEGGFPIVGSGGGLEARGRDPIVYTFVLPPEVTVRSVRFMADVAGDYRLGVRQTHDRFTVDRSGNVAMAEMSWPASFTQTQASKREPFKWYIPEGEEPYFTVVRASGANGTGTNRQMVSFDYGIPTGQSLASVNWNADLVGMSVSGEFAHNLQNYMFPVGDNEGQRSSQRAVAWWLKGTKDLFAGMVLGGEVYQMEPNYAGGYDSYRGGLPFHIDRQPSPGARIESATQEFGLHEDNDDHDRFADDQLNDSATAEPRELYPGYPNAMVYPGLDDNVDNIPDVDRNENFIVDWEEPFVTYDAEPPDFVYGIDFNNNSVPDFRENDDKPDYPYPRDQKGRHTFLRFDKLGFLGKSISVGTYASQQLVGSGESEGIYLRYEYELKRRGLGSIGINFDVKKVQDDIADHTYIYQVPPDDIELINWINRPDGPPEEDGYRRPATPDRLLMRDSFVSTFFVETQYLGFANLNIENSVLYFRNNQAEIELDDGTGLLQPEDVRARFAVVNKIDYRWQRGNWLVTPKFKHRTIWEKIDSEEDPRLSYSDFIPIIMGEYRLTPKTSVQMGAQGLPFIPYRHWNRSVKDDSHSQVDYLAMMKITADYFGIRDNSVFFGYQRTHRDYSKETRPNFKQGVLFVELISPF